MMIKARYLALTFLASVLTAASPLAAAQDIVIDSGSDETVIARLPAAPPQDAPVCSNGADGTLGPCVGPGERFTQRILGGSTCPQNGCTFSSAGGAFDVPDGKVVLVDTVTIAYTINDSVNADNFLPSTASFQTTTPFQRFMIGEMLPVVYTGAIGMATANFSFYSTGITGIVTFTDELPVADSIVSMSVFVTGRLIDMPAE